MPQYRNKETRNGAYLGIDPGTHRIGYGAVLKTNNKLTLIDQGVIEIKDKKYSPEHLCEIYNRISSIIDDINPKEAAVEKIFFSKNRKTAMSVAEARGVILLAIAKKGVKISEFSPNTVKQSISGYGSADKKAVLKMTKIILGIKDFDPIDDVSDALAIAITAALTGIV
jgi:crossover junction endodeoxyribonuclease RuvC